jgi:hypothetical protein
MPRNYQNGKIYTIRSRSRPDLIYVGSTIQSLSARMVEHRAPSNACSSKQIIALSDAYIELLETYPCLNVEELRRRENYHMRSMECINTQLAISDCPHGKEHAHCKLCHGASICEHNRHRDKCKICHGSGICEHNKRRNECVLCEGSGICSHNMRKTRCIDCNGTSICIHNQRREMCKICGGSAICVHNLQRRTCKACSPAECDFCDMTTSKALFKRHLKTQKHKDNYKEEFSRVFDVEITDSDVPQF